MHSSALVRFWKRNIAAKWREQDSGFRDVIMRQLVRGMRIAGILGFILPIVWIAGRMVTGGHLAIRYGDPRGYVVWDKLTIQLVSVLVFGASWLRIGREYGRLLAGLMLFCAATVMMVDDVMMGDFTFAAGWATWILLIAMGVIPFRPVQFLLLGVSVFLSLLFCMLILPTFLEHAVRFDYNQATQLTITTVLCVVVSSLLYNRRYAQFVALKKSRELTRRVEAQATDLREAEALKDRFFANISHELRTSLTLVLGPIRDGLNDMYGPLDGNLERSFSLMYRNGVRLLRLVNQLLDLAKLESGEMHLHVRPQDLNTLVKYVVASFSWWAKRRNITMTLDSSVPDLTVYYDTDKLEKALTNVISNAVKFTPAGGKVHISIASPVDSSAHVEITVRDTGPGIPASRLPHVFDRFYQGDDTGVSTGTGVGLALARDVVELHAGVIGVESTEGFGSTFTIRLPLGKDHFSPDALVDLAEPTEVTLQPATEEWLPIELGEADQPASAEGAKEEDTRPLVAVIDDDTDIRSYLTQLLRDSYRVREAADGESGFQLIRAESPDLVICDVMMPKSGGFEVCRQIRSDEKLSDTPVLMLTARSGEENKMEGLASGADDYVVKPFHAEMLLARVENLIAIRRMLRRKYSDEIVLKPKDLVVESADGQLLQRVMTVIEEHLGDSEFGVDWLADEVALSPRHLQRKLRHLTNLSAKGLINTMRLKRSAQMLESQAGTVSQIAYWVGFKDAGYFSRLFRQTFGSSPSEHAAAALNRHLPN